MASQNQNINDKKTDCVHSVEDNDDDVSNIFDRRNSPKFTDTVRDDLRSRRVIFSPHSTNTGSDDDTDDSDTDDSDGDFCTGEVLEGIRLLYADEISEGFSKYDSPISPDRNIIHDIEERIRHIPPETQAEEPVTSCANCCTPRRVENVSCFKKGQHIRLPGQYLQFNFRRKLIKAYHRHAIIKSVINTYENNTSGNEVTLRLIHFTQMKGKIKITEEVKFFDLENDEIDIIDYMHPRYNPDIIVQRAESMLPKSTTSEEQKQFSSYNLLVCNCEHFASWCVVGEGECFQVKGFLKSLKKSFVKMAGLASKIWRFVKRFLYNASDETATVVNLELLGLGASAVIYLLYAVGMTLYYLRKYSKAKLCKVCMKHKIISLWCSFGAFCVTSVVSYIIVHLLLPLIVPTPVGIPLSIVIVVLSLILQWGISKIIRALRSPYACDEIEVKDLSQITPGSMISFNYFGVKHSAIVTENLVESGKTEVGFLKYVHYGLEGFTREVVEEGFQLNLKRNTKNVKLIDCQQLRTFPPEITIERVRARIGETKWSPISNRSDHLCFNSIVHEESDKADYIAHQTEKSESTSKGKKSTFYLGKREIHHKSDLQIGQIVKYDGQTGIIVALNDITGGGDQRFKMKLVVYLRLPTYRAVRRTYSVDLKRERLFVKKYHPAHCCPFEERVRRALEWVNKACPLWTRTGFLESCIIKRLSLTLYEPSFRERMIDFCSVFSQLWIKTRILY